MPPTLDHLIGDREYARRQSKAERLSIDLALAPRERFAG
jgi:hypothetical protein